MKKQKKLNIKVRDLFEERHGWQAASAGITALQAPPRPSGGYRTLPVPENGIYRWTAIASLTRKGLLKAAAALARSDFVKVHYGKSCEGRRIVFTDQRIERTNTKRKYGLRTQSHNSKAFSCSPMTMLFVDVLILMDDCPKRSLTKSPGFLGLEKYLTDIGRPSNSKPFISRINQR